jgi:hypothetical protein
MAPDFHLLSCYPTLFHHFSSFMLDNFFCSHSTDYIEFTLLQISLQPLVQCLDVDKLILLFTAVLLERRILLRSNKFVDSPLATFVNLPLLPVNPYLCMTLAS